MSEAVLKQLSEIYRQIGRAQGQIEAIDIKLDALHQLLRTTQWWTLCVGILLAADFAATGVALLTLVRVR